MTAKCPDRSQVSVYADGELDRGAATRMEAHLTACSDCRRRLNAYRNVDRLIGELPEVSVSPAFEHRFSERLEALAGRPTGMERLRGALSRGALLRGSLFRGSLLRGTLFRGTLFRGTLFRAPLLRGLLSGWRPVWAAGMAACLVAGLFLYNQDGEERLSMEEIVIVENLELFRDFELIQKLELLENWERSQEGPERS